MKETKNVVKNETKIQTIIKEQTECLRININSQITIAHVELNGKPFGAGKANHIFLK